MLLRLLPVLFGVAASIPFLGTEQSVAVKGQLTCNGTAAVGIRVKLFEKDPILDDQLDEVVTDKDGRFELHGTDTEMSLIDPKVNVYHKCNYDGPCYRKTGIKIPDSAVYEGPKAEKAHDLGNLNLDTRYENEDVDCLN